MAKQTGTKDIDIIQKIFEHRLQQADLESILDVLSSGERDELIGKIGDLLRRISALVEVSNKVSDTLSLDVLLPRLMEIVTEALNADRSTLFLNDPNTDELFSRVAQGDSMGEIRFPNHLGIAGSVFTEGEGIIIPDAYADPRFNQEVDKKTGYRTRNILCTPILNKQRKVIGVAQVLNKHVGDFDDEDMTMLAALTSQAASALENARLFEMLERQQKEEAKLLEITSAISSNLQLDALLQRVINVTTDMLEADRSTLFMYDPKTDELWSRVAEGLDVKEIRFPSFAGIAGTCFTEGEVINIPEAYEDSRFNQEVDKKTGYRTRSILCMPIINKDGRKLGIMQVLNKKGGPFGPNDESRLRAFTAQAAIALENAQLFEDVLNEKNYNESILKSLSNGVITLDVEKRVITANDAIMRILKWDTDEIVGKTIEELFAHEDNSWILESIEKVVQSGEIDIAMDADVFLKDGSSASANMTVVPLINVNEEAIGYMLIIEDITSEKRVKSTMARYMTKEVAEKLLEGGEDALGGTSQVASVLFSDIRSFTTISEMLGARETVSMLNDYFTDMIDVIFQHGGILDKYIGDAIMALFGAPFPTDQDAVNAVIVAEEMIRVLRKLNAQRAEAGKMEIKIGIGVSTGELVAGNIGSPKRMDYTAIGDTVNLAARLESATKYYGVEILWSEFTHSELNGNTLFREVDLIRVKGKNKPVAIYEGLGFHTPESFPNMKETLETFDAGVKHYRNSDWDQAIKSFESVLKLRADDGPSKLYLDRCQLYKKTPPPEDWGGVFTMTTK